MPDNTQQDGQEQTGSDARVGGRRDSHGEPFTLAPIVPELYTLMQPVPSYFIETNTLRQLEDLGRGFPEFCTLDRNENARK